MKEHLVFFSKPNFGALGIFRLAHLIWGLDTPPRLTMLRVGTQWSEEQTSGRTALSDHLYHVISSHKHFWWARVGQSRSELARVGWRKVSGKTQGSGFRIRAAHHIPCRTGALHGRERPR